MGCETLTWIFAITNYQSSDAYHRLWKHQSQQPVYLRRTVWAMNDLSQRTTFVHWKCSHYSLCCPLSEAKAGVQQCPSTAGHRGVRADGFIIHSWQRLLRAEHIQDVVQASFCHAAQYGLSLAGKDLTAVSFAARTLSERKTKGDKPVFFPPEVVRNW